MAGTPLQFSLAPNINPMSGTGSDLHELNQETPFGDINMGGANNSPVVAIARDVMIGLAVALAAKYLWSKIK